MRSGFLNLEIITVLDVCLSEKNEAICINSNDKKVFEALAVPLEEIFFVALSP
jgi:hypothetical protein